jgi:iron complex outermembrane recepter protein
MKVFRTGLLACVSMTGLSFPAFGQAETDGARENLQLDEIIVTAQRRQERLKDVPISVSALSERDLEARGTQNVRDIQYAVPNVTLLSQNGGNFNTNIIIRGISSSARNVGFESGLGVYVDGVYTGRGETFTQQLEDIERLEVLRGPQGTLFGKNTTIGAINITTRRPETAPEGFAVGEYGNYNSYRISGGVSGGIVGDIVAAKISGFASGHDGYIRNANPTGRRDFQDDRSEGVRGEVRLRPSEGWDVAFRGDWSKARIYAYEAEVIDIPADGNPLGLLIDSVVAGPRSINVDRDGRNVRETYGGSLTIEHAFASGLTLTSVTAQRELRSGLTNFDIDLTSLDFLSTDYVDRTSQFTQEIRLTSPSAGRLKYVIGGYFFDQSARSRRDTVLQPVSFQILQSFGIPDFLFEPNAISTNVDVKTKSIAGFANGSFDVTDKLSILGGIRVTREKKRLEIGQTVPAFLGLPGVLGPLPIYVDVPGAGDRLRQTDVSPTVGLLYRLSDAANVYARYSKGFKSGGWNAELVAPNSNNDSFFDVSAIRFDSESIENYEVGFKGQFLERRLSVNLSAFWQNFNDVQITRFIGGLQGYATDNAGKARSRGIEVEVAAQPVTDVMLTANIGYTNAKYLRYVDGCGPGCDLSGTRLNAPRITASASAQYTPALTDSIRGLMRVDLFHRSSTPGTGDAIERATTFGDDLTLVDLRIGASNETGIELSAFVKNLFDVTTVLERTLNSNLALFGVAQQTAYFNDPRTYGIRLAYRF